MAFFVLRAWVNAERQSRADLNFSAILIRWEIAPALEIVTSPS